MQRLISKFEESDIVSDATSSGRSVIIEEKCSDVKETIEGLAIESRYGEAVQEKVLKSQ